VSHNDAPDDESPDGEAELTDIHFVGPATAEVLAGAEFDATAIPDKTVSFEMLVDAGVNPGVAERIRKEHSLPWSLGGDENSLDERSEKVRGLQDEERAWVAASSGDWEARDPEASSGETSSATLTNGDWTPTAGSRDSGTAASDDARTAEASTDGSGAAEAAEAAWRERSRPDPVTDVPGVDDRTAELLASGGITSVRSLATADPEHVADSLGLERARVAEWRDAARDLV